MVNTNIAPQWQPFNGGNWAKLEKAVRTYSDTNNKRVFVFTGTGKT
jgi:DNA/RNA endonuclease G (NUC1)